MQRHNRCIWTSRIRNLTQNGSLQDRFGVESPQHRNTNTAKYGPLPRPHHHPNLWAALYKVDASSPTQTHERGCEGTSHSKWSTKSTAPIGQCTWTRRRMEQENYQSTPHHGTISRHHRSYGWKSRWIVNVVGEPARRGRSIAEFQSVMTP